MPDSRKKICVVRFFYFPQEAHVRRDVRALIDKGFDVRVVCARMPGEKRFENWQGVKVYRLSMFHRRQSALRYIFEYIYFTLKALMRVTDLYFKAPFGSIEIDTMPDILVLSSLVPRMFGARVVLYLFENMRILLAAKNGLNLSHPFIRLTGFIEKMSCSLADHVLITYDRIDLRHKKVTVIQNVPDAEFFASARHRERGSFPPKDGQIRIVTHSTITKIYGIQHVIKAMATVVRSHPRATLTIIGDGEYKEELEKLAAAMGLRDNVAFTGFIPFSEIAGNLAQYDIGIVSVASGVLVPNKLFEYVALKIPVVCAGHDTIKAMFSDQEMAYYEPNASDSLAERIDWTIKNYDYATASAERAWIKYRSKYSWDIVKHRYAGVYLDPNAAGGTR